MQKKTLKEAGNSGTWSKVKDKVALLVGLFAETQE